MIVRRSTGLGWKEGMVALTLLLVLDSCSSTGEGSTEPIIVTGVIVHQNDGQTMPEVTTVSYVPTDRNDTISGVEVVFSNSTGERNVATSGADGRFTVSLSSIGGQAQDSLVFRDGAHRGFELRNLRVGEGLLPLNPGRNSILVELVPKPACPLKRPKDRE